MGSEFNATQPSMECFCSTTPRGRAAAALQRADASELQALIIEYEGHEHEGLCAGDTCHDKHDGSLLNRCELHEALGHAKDRLVAYLDEGDEIVCSVRVTCGQLVLTSSKSLKQRMSIEAMKRLIMQDVLRELMVRFMQPDAVVVLLGDAPVGEDAQTLEEVD